METLTLAGGDPGHTGGLVGWLHELDLGLAGPEEGDPDAVDGDLHHGPEGHPQEISIQPEARLNGPDDERNVMDARRAVDDPLCQLHAHGQPPRPRWRLDGAGRPDSTRLSRPAPVRIGPSPVNPARAGSAPDARPLRGG